ncbi:Raf kinase inhibitor-like YbhB/YbcL family protein [Mycoplana sp. BE70]|uniref:YbhB/YbcL family Raf kinase inhibitor-like protein n=1 Tax=Mycoplana sp. BE70 TaxID=2817775 RepID=UPI0028588548|nr:YbhB/YbcL family Raf kinase inhibitor-like protein [Mycoplana sp. BE70]MDR6758648.1 Raf kinase inhibitor-like YbhB/YbcL family protein [Mycoplana sp. BE70]
MGFTLMSPAFAEGGTIPLKYTRMGENLCPPLKWTGAPEGTLSFALVIEDPDAPRGTFRHFGLSNIPSDWTELPASADTAPDHGSRFHKNDFGNVRYDGPQPPPGSGPHRYVFRLAALDVARLGLPDAVDAASMWAAARKHSVAEATLTGLYER